MTYVKICPKCNSDMVKMTFDKEKKRFVSKCLNCSFKGDTLFEDVDLKLVEAKHYINENARRNNEKT